MCPTKWWASEVDPAPFLPSRGSQVDCEIKKQRIPHHVALRCWLCSGRVLCKRRWPELCLLWRRGSKEASQVQWPTNGPWTQKLTQQTRPCEGLAGQDKKTQETVQVTGWRTEGPLRPVCTHILQWRTQNFKWPCRVSQPLTLDHGSAPRSGDS